MKEVAESRPIEKGELFYISTGAYSDYTIDGVFRATEEIDTEKLLKEWFLAHPEQTKRYCFDVLMFIRSIIHLLEPVHCLDWHLEDYHSIGDNYLNDVTAEGWKDA